MQDGRFTFLLALLDPATYKATEKIVTVEQAKSSPNNKTSEQQSVRDVVIAFHAFQFGGAVFAIVLASPMTFIS